MSMDDIQTDPEKMQLNLVGCGILYKELRSLIIKHNWPITLRLFDSSLHVNFNKLQHTLEKWLTKSDNASTIVFYGACHPRMDKILWSNNTLRTQGQNCVEILLGKEIFTAELEKGAFFLMEDWAKRFEHVTGIAFNDKPEVTRAIFQMEHKYLLGLRTPCSGDFTSHAERVSSLVGLPLHWLDVNLDHLEQTLEYTIEQRRTLP